MTIPGSVMVDRFLLELYEAKLPRVQPVRMLASGRVDISMARHTRAPARWHPATYAVGTQGPPGPQGIRGSRWYTGAGVPDVDTPVPDERVDGDMYLNETNGDVWRWDMPAKSWRAFKEV